MHTKTHDGLSVIAPRTPAARAAAWVMSAVGVLACAGLAGGQPEPREAAGPAPERAAAPAAAAPIVVLELFTSEGCSSCPPADRLVSKLVRERAGNGAAKANAAAAPKFIVLSHHVDYWDRLGWPDRFGSADATRRQRAYAAELATSRGDEHGGVYTPQIVVNGATGFVGSHADRARAAIRAAEARPASVGVQLTLTPGTKEGTLTAAAVLEGGAAVPAETRVVFAVTEDGLTTAVKRGENAGERMEHDRVVRVMTRGEIKDRRATAEITLPADVQRDKARVVVLVQRGEGGAVLGADEQPVPPIASGTTK